MAPGEPGNRCKNRICLLAGGRLGRLMRTAGLTCKAKHKFKATTHSAPNLPVADNRLDRNFTVPQANQA